MSFELIPFDDIKDLLGLTGDLITEYPDLAVLASRLLHSFQEFTGREFEQVERVEEIYVHGTPTQMFPLKGLPVSSVSSVVLSSTNYGEETLTEDYYDVVDFGLRIASKVRNVKAAITYTGGLSVTTGPLKAAALYQLAYEFQSKDQVGAESVTTEGGSVFKPALSLLKETKRMLQSSLHPMNLGGY